MTINYPSIAPDAARRLLDALANWNRAMEVADGRGREDDLDYENDMANELEAVVEEEGFPNMAEACDTLRANGYHMPWREA